MKLGLSLGALAGVQLAAGLGLQIVVFAIVGAGAHTDAFIAAQTIPMLASSVFATPLQAMWQPRLSISALDLPGWREQQGIAQGQVVMMVGSVVLLLAATAYWWLPLLFPGLQAGQISRTVGMAQVLFLGALLNAHSLLLTTALRAREQFITPELVAALSAVAAVALAMLIVPSHGVMGAAWISTARSAVVVATLFVLAGRPGISLFAAATDRLAWSQVRPLLAGSSIYKCSPLIDRYWGSQAAAGGLTLLTLSQTGLGALAQIIERAACVPVTPRLARLAQAGEFEAMRVLVRRSIWRVAMLSGIVLVVLLAVYPYWATALLIAFKLQEPAAHQMWLVCVCLLGYLLVAASGAVPVAAFYALGDTKTPVKISVTAFVIGVAAKSLAFLGWGLPGLALATSMYYLTNLLVVCLVLEKRLDVGSS